MKQNITTYILCGFFIITAAAIQAITYLNTDSAWLVESAVKLLFGQDLYTDYIETNPPFIVYFTCIPVWLGGLVGLAPYNSFKLFVMLLVLLSAKQSFKYLPSNFLKIAVVTGLFLLPVQSFGQREHLFLALIMPYFLSVFYNKKATGIDITMALISYLLKPYFIVYFIGLALWQKIIMKRPILISDNFIITGVVPTGTVTRRSRGMIP